MKNFFGELLGTFVLVAIGCGSVGWSIFIHPLSLIEVASIWGVAVIIAIYLAMSFSHAHLNPAVSIGFYIKREISLKELLVYFLGQFAGAFIAGVILYCSFHSLILEKDLKSAMMFGEYYPNPGNPELQSLSEFFACFLEGLGTFILMLGILLIGQLKLKYYRIINPILVGLLLAGLIYFIAPYTQAGFNPARDFAPRLVSTILGWDADLTFIGSGWFSVYIAGPILGAALAAFAHLKLKFKT